ncbi:MAG: tRNA (adenosine(37)-N6)-dimethylallyltransferase MiaA, partial [Clostridia bacterium]|nr:tRNA (adenosine(37)-N6)-dimethylallyltransferase MiaA [Clostridia bacterium]
MEKKPELIVICGPTAAGKTAVAVETAKRVGGVIISADSMQIYKELSIGTAKPTKEELDGVDCRLIDFVEPDGEYNVFRFKQDAEREIADVVSAGKVPVLCGGTGLYIDVLTSNTELSAESNDESVRSELKKQAEELGSVELHSKLEEVDKASAERIHPNDVKRV